MVKWLAPLSQNARGLGSIPALGTHFHHQHTKHEISAIGGHTVVEHFILSFKKAQKYMPEGLETVVKS